MSKLKEKYIKVFVEESLNESSQYGIYLSNDEFMKYFVSPFTDVLKAAKLALKDVGSGVLYNMRILFTFSTTKKKRLLEAYKQKREQFDKEHADFVKNVTEDIKTEIAVISFMANPTLFLGAAAVKKGIDAGKFVNDVFKEQRDAMKDAEDPGSGGPTGPTAQPRGPIRGALADLKNLFFGESYKKDFVNILMEAGGENPDISAEIEEEIKKQGVDFNASEIQQGFKEFVSMKEDAIKEITDEGIPDRLESLAAMMSAENYQKLEAAVNKAKSAGVDLGNYLSDFDNELQRGKEEIAVAFKDGKEEEKKGEKESELLKKMRKLPKLKKLGDKATEKDYVTEMENYLFNTLKSNLQEDAIKIMREIQKDTSEVIDIVLSPYESIEQMRNELSGLSSESDSIVEKVSKLVKTLQFK